MTVYLQTEPVLAGWLDKNQDEQDQIIEWLRLLQQKEALDELGVGTIQEAFSDKLFPGITTNQTRAKYLVILPYLFNDAVDKIAHNSKTNVAEYLEDAQVELVKTFLRNGEKDGVIGRNNPDRENKPLSVYWNALKTFHIVSPNLSREQMFDLIRQSAKEKQQNSKRSKKGKKQSDNFSEDDSDLFLDEPLLPIELDFENWEDDLSMSLSYNEAAFISSRIKEYTPNSALAQLLKFYRKHSNIKLTKSLGFEDIPEPALNEKEDIKRIYQLSKDYRDFIFGADLAYSYLLSNRKDDIVKKVYNDWKKNGNWRKPEFDKRLEKIFDESGANGDQRKFLEDLFKFAKADDWKSFEECVKKRECEVKGNRKKIGSPDNKYKFYKDEKYVYRDLKPRFRWAQAKRILIDILDGLKNK